jgi:hypothetical protein
MLDERRLRRVLVAERFRVLTLLAVILNALRALRVPTQSRREHR